VKSSCELRDSTDTDDVKAKITAALVQITPVILKDTGKERHAVTNLVVYARM
jgi:hypothetical protein